MPCIGCIVYVDELINVHRMGLHAQARNMSVKFTRCRKVTHQVEFDLIDVIPRRASVTCALAEGCPDVVALLLSNSDVSNS